MILEDKKYQETAIDNLILSVADLLQKDTKNKVCIFQSPTGSGKTVMVAKFIEGLIREYPDLDFCFLWASIGKGELHKQSKKSLEKIFNAYLLLGNIELKGRNKYSTAINRNGFAFS